MNETLATFLEQARVYVLEYAPSSALKEAVPFGILCLTIGIILSVLGAKLSRFAMTSAFVLFGAWVGMYFAEQTGYSKPACGLTCAAMVGLVGFQTFRIWVGILAAVVFASASMSVFGYQKIMPHIQAFQQTVPVDTPIALEDGTFSLQNPLANPLTYPPQQWAKDLWTFASEKDANTSRNGQAIMLGSLMAGLCFGVIAMRWALILSTALLGTAMVTTASATLLLSTDQAYYQTIQANPQVLGTAVGALLVSSIVLQTMLTRRPKTASA